MTHEEMIEQIIREEQGKIDRDEAEEKLAEIRREVRNKLLREKYEREAEFHPNVSNTVQPRDQSARK